MLRDLLTALHDSSHVEDFHPGDFLSHVWKRESREAASAEHAGFGAFLHPPAATGRHSVSFKQDEGSVDTTKCYCPAMGHCVPGFQCPLGEHIDRSKCFSTVTVRYGPDTDYQECLKEKEEEPEKKCELKMLQDIKIGTGGWRYFGGEDHPIVKKVKGVAEAAGVKKGYELISIDGNQADWREKGFKEYVKNLNWDVPPPGQPVECEPGDGCKKPCPPPPPPPVLPRFGPFGRFPFSFQQLPNVEEAPANKTCYPNGHSLTFKVTTPPWMFWAQTKSTCRAFRETCCAEASTRRKPEDIFAESCATKEMCKPQETCDQMEGRPGICKYQVLELNGDYDDKQENEDKQEEAMKQAEEQEQNQEREEERQEAEDAGEEPEEQSDMNLQQEGHEPGNEEGHEQGYGQENEQGHQQDGQEGEDRSGSSFL